MFLQRDDIKDPDAVFELRRAPSPGARAWMPFTRTQFEGMRAANADLAQMAGLVPGLSARSGGSPIEGVLVTGTFFSVIGVDAHRGRTIGEQNDRRGSPNAVVVLSHSAWRRLFQSKDEAVGQTLIINGMACHIVGVMPPNFRGLANVAPDFWAPVGLSGAFRPALRGKENVATLTTVVARLEDNVAAAQAETRLTAWVQSRVDLPASGNSAKTIRLLPRGAPTFTDAMEGLPWFGALFLTCGLILLIGASNVSNLYLARGLARQKELAIRSALGASRRRLVFLLTIDGFVLALVASAIAFVTAEWWLNVGLQGAMTRLVPDNGASRLYMAAPADWRLLVVLVCCSVLVTVVSALGPALPVTRHVTARSGRTISTAASSTGRKRFFITAQVASSVVLLIVSSLLLQGARRAAASEVVVRVDDTLFVQAPQAQTRDAVLDAITSTPGVTGIAAAAPFGFGGEPAGAVGTVEAPVDYRLVSPEYFQILDVPVRKGRTFADSERDPSAGVAVVATDVALRLWPGVDPVGQSLTLRPSSRPAVPRAGHSDETPALVTTTFSVVGVVQRVRIGIGMFQQHDAGVYLPADITTPGMSFVVRASGDHDDARRMLFDRIDRVDPSINAITTVRQMVNRSGDYLRAVAALTLVVGAIALVLTAAGLPAVMSHLVSHRRQEIGIRLALGATTSDIARSVYAPLTRPIVIGLGSGSVLAWWGAKALSMTPVLDLLHANDPIAYLAGGGSVVLVAVLACLIPAARATRVDPVTTLRES